ncbi:hypothetical protein [Mesorhizobium sp.]|nr:hypothetical protein [Mesorhizobium sp.]
MVNSNASARQSRAIGKVVEGVVSSRSASGGNNPKANEGAFN